MDSYGITKALHIVSVISWMAGLLYLPRLFVYHSNVEILRKTSEIFKIMELRLYKFIMFPALIVTWLTGCYLVFLNEIYNKNWLLIKFFLVVLMSFFHFILGMYISKFERDINIHSSKFFRLINEIPTVIMIAIIFLVVLKPEM